MVLLWGVVFVLSLVFSSIAQMPHEVLVIANQSSAGSLEVANAFMERRGIPADNLVRLAIPESVYGRSATCDSDTFEALIWTPVHKAVVSRQLEDQILAWVYSTDFPIRIKTDASDRRQVSICGQTFLKNRRVEGALIEEGKYHSPIFAGPNERFRLLFPSCSLGVLKSGLGSRAGEDKSVERLRLGLGWRMPLPSMMLGYTGEGGSSLDSVLKVLERGQKADYKGLRSGIYFVTNSNVRSSCRDWQFVPTKKRLAERRLEVIVTNDFPGSSSSIMGLFCGVETVRPSDVGKFAPGAVAEHLTSWGAEFQRPQTKCTEWLDAGATATCGSVVEPYANANKFPSARFFEHYTAGCSVLESFYQSVASPLQQLFLGDPLARPYVPLVRVRLLGAVELSKEPFRFRADVSTQLRGVSWRYTFLLDGRVVDAASEMSSYRVNPFELADGYHTLKCVAWVDHSVRFYGSDTKSFIVNRLGRAISINTNIKKLDAGIHGFQVEVDGADIPERVRLISGGEVLDEGRYTSNMILRFQESRVGNGMCRLQVIGVYADGMEVASEPLVLKVFNSVNE